MTAHEKHAFDAVDLLLKRRCDRLGDDVGRRAWVYRRDLDGWRDDFRILSDGQRPQCAQSYQHDEDADDGRQYGSVDEEVREGHSQRAFSFDGAGDAISIAPCSGVTRPPGVARTKTVNDNVVLGIEAAAHDAQAPVQASECNFLRDNRLIWRNSHYDMVGLIHRYGGVGYQQSRASLARRQANMRKFAGNKALIRVVDSGACSNGPGTAIENIVEKLQLATPEVGLFVAQIKFDLARNRAVAMRLLIIEKLVLAHIEVEIDGTDGDYRGEKRGRTGRRPAAAHQGSNGHPVRADFAVERGRHMAIVEVKLSVRDGLSCGVDRSACGLLVGTALIDAFPGARKRQPQLLGA